MATDTFVDRPVPVANHLEELHKVIRRSALAFLAIAALTLIWIDSIISDWALLQSPAGALSIYGPYDWVEMRITAVFIIAATLTLPILSLDMRYFAHPGLSPAERRWLTSYLVLSAIAVPLTLYWVWFEMIPYFVYLGVELDSISGVSTHYDAAELFSLASGLSWILILLFLSTFFLSLSRLFGLVEDGHSRFRNRTLAICAGTLILTLPDTFEGVRVLIALSVVLVAEFVSRSTPTGPLGPRLNRISEVYDRDGGIQRVMVLDCSCEGACPRMNRTWVHSGVAVAEASTLCLEPTEQEHLLDMARNTQLTRLTITGCDGSPVPSHLRSSLQSAGVNIDGLGWLDTPHSESDAWRRQSIQMHSSQFSAPTRKPKNSANNES